jgi:hypothetical protein
MIRDRKLRRAQPNCPPGEISVKEKLMRLCLHALEKVGLSRVEQQCAPLVGNRLGVPGKVSLRMRAGLGPAGHGSSTMPCARLCPELGASASWSAPVPAD